MGRYMPGMGHERRFPGTSVNGRPKRARECLLKVMSADRALARRTLGNGSISAARIGQHLKSLCEEDRGEILQQIGTDRKFRYRFVEPMMQPFILIQGLRTGQITRQQVNDLAATHDQPRFSNDF
jgi:hypothetical protein